MNLLFDTLENIFISKPSTVYKYLPPLVPLNSLSFTYLYHPYKDIIPIENESTYLNLGSFFINSSSCVNPYSYI